MRFLTLLSRPFGLRGWRQMFAWFAFLLPASVVAQEYQLRQFRVEHGLPANVIKAITQDSLGYFWIATDEGLVQFDGLRFTTYKSAMHNQYVKGFLHSRSGKMYAFGDLDLIEVKNLGDSAVFKQVLRGTRNPTDSTLWFPKAMYEDRDGSLWVAEPQSVAMYRKGVLHRFRFGIEDRSPQFLRSFTFFEDKLGFLYTVSFSGNAFMFDPDEYTFIKEPIQFPSGVNHIKMEGNHLLIAAANGVYRSELLSQGGFSKPILLSPPNWPMGASHILKMDSARWLVTTFDRAQYLTDLDQTWEELPFEVNDVNSSYLSQEGDLWMASNDGAVLLQKNLFFAVRSPDPVTFVESITEDTATHSIYYGTMTTLYKVNAPHGPDPNLVATRVFSVPNGYFQSIAYSEDRLWASNAFSLFLFKNDRLNRRWDFGADGRFVHDIFLDRKGYLWLSQAGNTYVTRIDSNFKMRRYPVPLHQEGIVNCVREGHHGLYVASNGNQDYLFFKSETDSAFRNISVPLGFEPHGDFNVTDIAVLDSIAWLATSEGLIRFDGKKGRRIDIGDMYSALPVKTVKVLQSRYLVFDNSFGIFRYDVETSEYWRYDEANGLPSNTITTRGIYVDHHGRVWTGTSFGLGVSSRALINDQPTQFPRFVGLEVNGSPRRYLDGLKVPFGAYFSLNLSCISFPADHIQIQYRIPSLDTTWRTVSENRITFTDLRAGRYLVEARAKKNGGFRWSETSRMEFQVEHPFWEQSWFTASAVLLVAFIAWISFALAAYINRKRRQLLEDIVNQRTLELKRINEELSMRNSELDRFVYSTSHDLSAPLKSIRGLISVAKMEKPPHSLLAYLEMMERSVRKLEAFIADVINYSRNTRAPVELSVINFEPFIQQLLDDHQYAPNYGKIRFTVEDRTTTPIRSDEMRLRIIFNNLISNAIKFHFTDRGETPFVSVTADEDGENFVFRVIDNGSGIHPEFKNRIFDMFFRANDHVQGSGLGLYILRETVIKLGGEIDVETALDVGTTFTIRLPMSLS